VKDKFIKRKKGKIECCDICVDIREKERNKKRKRKQTLHSLNYCFFIAAVLLLLQKVNKKTKQ